MAKQQGIWKRGKIYHFGFVHPTTGKYIRKSSKSVLPSKALEKLNQAKSDADKGLSASTSNSITVRQLIDWCWENHWSFDKRANKEIRYGYMKAPLDEFGDVKAAELTPDMLRAFMKERLKSVKKKSVELEFSSIRCAYNQAIKNDRLTANPFKKLDKKLFQEDEYDNGRTRIGSPKEIDLLIGNSAGMLQKIVEFDLNSGLRKGQIENLRRQDVDLINRTMAVGCGKGGRYRTYKVPIFDRALEILKSLPMDTEYIFTNPEGNRIPKNGLIHAGFPRLVKRCAIVDFKFHDLRHTFATDYYRQTKDLAAIQMILGHRDVNTTKIYLNLTDADLVPKANYRFDVPCHVYVTNGELKTVEISKIA